jgi:hypothetical protein
MVAAEHAHVLPHKRRDSGKIRLGYFFATFSQVPHCLVEIQAVEQAYCVDHQPQGAKLVLLAFAVVLTDLASFAVEDLAGQLVALLVAV